VVALPYQFVFEGPNGIVLVLVKTGSPLFFIAAGVDVFGGSQ